MADSNFHLDKILESANSINSLDFKHQGIFTNAILLKPDITTLIQDGNPEEQAMFSLDSNPQLKLRQKQSAVEDEKQWSFDALCEALRKLAHSYSIQGLDDKLKFYEMKWNRLNSSILHYEEVVEDGKRRLTTLASSLEERDFDNDTAERVDALIRQHEEDIQRIENEIDIKHREVSEISECGLQNMKFVSLLTTD